MIRKVNEMRTEVRSSMRGGKGDITIKHLLEAPETGEKARLIGLLTLEPGQSIGEHTHEPDGEIFIILSGTATVSDNGTKKELTKGDVMWISNGESHSLINNGSTPLELYAIIIE